MDSLDGRGMSAVDSNWLPLIDPLLHGRNRSIQLCSTVKKAARDYSIAIAKRMMANKTVRLVRDCMGSWELHGKCHLHGYHEIILEITWEKVGFVPWICLWVTYTVYRIHIRIHHMHAYACRKLEKTHRIVFPGWYVLPWCFLYHFQLSKDVRRRRWRFAAFTTITSQQMLMEKCGLEASWQFCSETGDPNMVVMIPWLCQNSYWKLPCIFFQEAWLFSIVMLADLHNTTRIASIILMGVFDLGVILWPSTIGIRGHILSDKPKGGRAKNILGMSSYAHSGHPYFFEPGRHQFQENWIWRFWWSILYSS